MSRRHFSKKGVEEGDSSVWTDTPAERERKEKQAQGLLVDVQETVNFAQTSSEVRTKAELIDTYNQTYRAKSLMKLHQEKEVKARKEQQHSDLPWQPFDRERDLQIRRPASTKKIIEGAQQLNSRFSSSSFL